MRDGRAYATQADLEESIEVVIAGYQKKNAILTDKEKWTVAYHEIGHALVAAKADKFCSSTEDHDYSENFRCIGLYDAGRGRHTLSYE